MTLCLHIDIVIIPTPSPYPPSTYTHARTATQNADGSQDYVAELISLLCQNAAMLITRPVNVITANPKFSSS